MTFTPNPEGLAAVVGEIVEDAATYCRNQVRDNIRSLGAIRTGALLRGVKVSGPAREGTKVSREVYNDVFYASFVEFGDGNGEAKPAMEMARQATEAKFR
jgi:hypothetical protein